MDWIWYHQVIGWLSGRSWCTFSNWRSLGCRLCLIVNVLWILLGLRLKGWNSCCPVVILGHARVRFFQFRSSLASALLLWDLPEHRGDIFERGRLLRAAGVDEQWVHSSLRREVFAVTRDGTQKGLVLGARSVLLLRFDEFWNRN